MKKIAILLLCISAAAQAQVKVPAQVQGLDTIAVITLPEFTCLWVMTPAERKAAVNYSRLRNRVIRVLPYARLAATMMQDLETRIKDMSQRERKREVKAFERELRDRFGAELKALSRDDGAVLIRLLDRETGSSGYEIVKGFRGTIQATLFQGLARLFGHNLKQKYDPAGDDRQIESVLRELYRPV